MLFHCHLFPCGDHLVVTSGDAQCTNLRWSRAKTSWLTWLGSLSFYLCLYASSHPVCIMCMAPALPGNSETVRQMEYEHLKAREKSPPLCWMDHWGQHQPPCLSLPSPGQHPGHSQNLSMTFRQTCATVFLIQLGLEVITVAKSLAE